MGWATAAWARCCCQTRGMQYPAYFRPDFVVALCVRRPWRTRWPPTTRRGWGCRGCPRLARLRSAGTQGGQPAARARARGGGPSAGSSPRRLGESAGARGQAALGAPLTQTRPVRSLCEARGRRRAPRRPSSAKAAERGRCVLAALRPAGSARRERADRLRTSPQASQPRPPALRTLRPSCRLVRACARACAARVQPAASVLAGVPALAGALRPQEARRTLSRRPTRPQ